MVSSIRHTWLGPSAALLGALVFAACGTDDGEGTAATGTPATTTGTLGSTTATVTATTAASVTSTTSTGTVSTTASATVGTETSSATASGTGGASSTTGTATGTDTGTGTSTTGGMEAPALLSETGLFTARVDGQLMLAEGVREFQPKYALWSDGALKNRYIYLPPGTQIDTSDEDHWVFPAGTK